MGDSWDYHIPISQSILDGSFINLPHPRIPQWYYPGSSEAINSFLMVLQIPLTLSNLFAIIILSFCLYYLGKTFQLSPSLSLLFALTFCTLNVIIRWSNSVSIDVWVAIWFTLSLTLLEKPQASLKYFLLLGFVLGMLVGSKYTAVMFILVLLPYYLKSILSVLNLPRFVIFLLPFSVFGLFWYIRNYFLTGNPIYPLPLLNLPFYPLFSDNILKIAMSYPQTMFNAFISEYHLWTLAPIFSIYYLVKNLKIINHSPVSILFQLGLINLVLYLFMPTSSEPQIMVSSLRYSYPAFIPLILGVFLLAAKYKKVEILGLLAISSMINILTMSYYPKLVFIYFPLALIFFHLKPGLFQRT